EVDCHSLDLNPAARVGNRKPCAGRCHPRPCVLEGRVRRHPRQNRHVAMTELRLLETVHPTRDGMKDFEALFGIDDLKEALTDELALILDRKRLEAWCLRHHAGGLGML